MFGDLCAAVIAELVNFIEESPESPDDSFYKALEEDVANLIKEMAAEEQAEISDEEMNEGEESRELIMAEIVQAKTLAFMDMIRIVKE
jgi:cytochrome b involved in lipid metabolism